ncbi:MAG: class I SAM-dependent methyltransferase [Elusimicrobiota bacterium]
MPYSVLSPLRLAAAEVRGPEAMAVRLRASWDETLDYRGARLLEGLFPFEEALVGLLPPKARLLIMGCGGGRDLLAWCGRGWPADGLEISLAAAERAREAMAEAGFSGKVLCQDAVEASLEPGAYGAILFSWLAYGYIPGAGRRAQALERARRGLAPGGRIYLLLKTRTPGGRAPWPIRLMARLSGRRPWLGPGDHVGDLGYWHSFTREEVEAEARAAGLSLKEWRVGERYLGVDCLAILA